MKRKVFLFTIFACVSALASVCAQAQEANDSIGAAIGFESYQTDINTGSGTYQAQVSEVGLALRQYFGRDFSLAMEVGYSELSYDNNPNATNFSPSGVYGRLIALYRWRIVPHFALDFKGTAAYHRLTNSNASGDFADRWWSYSASAGPRYSIRWFSVAAGLVYRHASGTEESPSAGDQSFGFARSTNPYLDFDFTVEPHGTVGVHFEGGARRSIALVFGYRFVSP
ncbi:MAG: hypothetical protein ACRETC_06305 [Gammaproteobacteria bacterium]